MTPEERAREFLKNEDGVLGDLYGIMGAFATMLVAEEREACAKTVKNAADHTMEHRVRPCCIQSLTDVAAVIRART